MRSADLLKAAVEALEDGRDPLTNSFLTDNEVTLDECYDLADNLALGARIVMTGLTDAASQERQVLMLTMAQKGVAEV